MQNPNMATTNANTTSIQYQDVLISILYLNTFQSPGLRIQR